MSEISRTVSDIIITAARKINLVGRDTEISGEIIEKGVTYLNLLLDFWQGKTLFIPFLEKSDFYLTAGIDTYYFGYKVFADVVVGSYTLLQIDNLKLTFDNVDSFPKNETNKSFERLADNVTQGTPSIYLFQRETEASYIKFNPTPDKAYTCTLWGKFQLGSVTKNTILDNVPPYYHYFLVFAIAKELADDYSSASWNQKLETRYQEIYNTLAEANDINFEQNVVNIFSPSYVYGIDYERL